MLHALLRSPGASRFIIDAHIPYSSEALVRILGKKPEQAVSPTTARALAQKAFFKNVNDLDKKGPIFKKIGIACTAALRTNRIRRGNDRAFLCIKTTNAEKLYVLHFSDISRAKQEDILSDWILTLLAQETKVERGLMLSGSFNPVHYGHFDLLKTAGILTGLRGFFELSRINVDKPPIEKNESLCRAADIHDIPVALTNAPRFVQKAKLFPHTTFVLGVDTAVRLIDNTQDKEWKRFRTSKTQFLVAGRQQGTLFKTLESLNVPTNLNTLFKPIPESVFREDISSSALRKKV